MINKKEEKMDLSTTYPQALVYIGPSKERVDGNAYTFGSCYIHKFENAMCRKQFNPMYTFYTRTRKGAYLLEGKFHDELNQNPNIEPAKVMYGAWYMEQPNRSDEWWTINSLEEIKEIIVKINPYQYRNK